MKKEQVKGILMLIIIISFSFLFSACKNVTTDTTKDLTTTNDSTTIVEAKVTYTMGQILKDTPFETPIYYFKSDIVGPKIAIVGGTHGDEVAGWTAALNLVESLKNSTKMKGEILIIPEANILADKALSRYTVSGYNLSDLNRSYPLDRYSSSTENTIMISDAIVKVIEDFNPSYIIDLHESRTSWTGMESGTSKTSLGDTLVASNNSHFMRQLIKYYNENYKKDGETDFRQEGSNQKGSFNYYFTNTYSDKIVFTIETNREYKNGTNNIALETRVRQQTNMLQSLFYLAWSL